MMGLFPRFHLLGPCPQFPDKRSADNACSAPQCSVSAEYAVGSCSRRPVMNGHKPGNPAKGKHCRERKRRRENLGAKSLCLPPPLAVDLLIPWTTENRHHIKCVGTGAETRPRPFPERALLPLGVSMFNLNRDEVVGS